MTEIDRLLELYNDLESTSYRNYPSEIIDEFHKLKDILESRIECRAQNDDWSLCENKTFASIKVEIKDDVWIKIELCKRHWDEYKHG